MAGEGAGSPASRLCLLGCEGRALVRSIPARCGVRRYNHLVLARSQIQEVFPLAACLRLAENSRLGFGPVASTSQWGSGFSISSSTLGLSPSLYDGRVRPRSTGKERDTESGNDYFGARYYASSMGRWLSPDWSAKVAPVPYAKLDNPQTLNLYDYMRNNPLAGIDTDGHDVVLLNDSNAAVGQGHNATLVGNDKGGWTYYSHDGYGSSGKDNPQHFGSFSDFQNSDASGRYDRGTRFSTNSDQDKAMNKVGTDEIKKPYDVTERGNHQNCADLSADVMKAGGLNTDKPKELTTPEMSTPAIQTPLGTIPSVTIPSVQVPAPITNPNQQYKDTVKNNNGTTVQPHCTGPNCH